MTEPTIEELRRWSAEDLMGCKVTFLPFDPGNYWYEKDGEVKYWQHEWKPDRPESGQIWMVIEKMRELGWWLDLTTNDKDEIDTYAEFKQSGRYRNSGRHSDDPCLAILKAAHAAKEER